MFRRKKRKPGETGQAAVEFALAVVVFIPILFGIIDLGWMTFQKTAFDYGYMYASREVKAKDIGDPDTMDIDETIIITGEPVTRPLRTLMEQYSSMIIPDNLHFDEDDAIAKFHTVKVEDDETYAVPSIEAGEVTKGRSRTRYMDLKVLVTYDIYPLTPIGKLMFEDSRWQVEKELDCTRIAWKQHRYEYR